MRRWIAVLALGAVVAACSEQATAPQPRTPAIAADFTNNLDNGNPRIVRFTESVWWVGWDDGPYTVLHVTGPYAVGLDPAQCWDGNYYLTGEQMVAHNPNEWWAGLVNAHDLGTIWTVVLDRTKPGPCWDYAIVGMGPAKLKVHSNNAVAMFYGIDVGGNRSDTYDFDAEGTLTRPEGGTVRYAGHLHMLYAADYSLKHFHAQIVVR